MWRLSRSQPLRRWILVLAIVAFVAMESFCIYLWILNRRISRELVRHAWRDATVVVASREAGGAEIARLYGADWRVTVPVLIKSLPPFVPNAFVAAEDVRFHHHVGIDPIGMARALLRNIHAGGIAQGGSTIDQQIIKGRFLTQERTWRRKIVEILLAVILDARVPKNEILEIYLNDVYLGHSGGHPVLGIDEAARIYLDKPASRLTLDEAALIASIIRAPNRDNPDKRPERVRARRDAILAVMRQHHWIDDRQYRAAIRRPAEFTEGSMPRAPYPYYLRALRADLVREVGIRTVIEGGLRITCEMNPAAQRAAEHAAARGAAQLAGRYPWIREQTRGEPLQTALLSVEPRSGGVRALVGGVDYELSPFDRTTNMHRQPGSAFKTFAYLPALAGKEATAASLLLDTPLTVEVGRGKSWQPHNYDERYRGRVSLREAFERSLNVPTVRLTQLIGGKRVIRTAGQFGFEEHFSDLPALPLGVTEVSMRELTAAYTPFAAEGVRTEPYLVREVVDRWGNSAYRHEVERKRLIGADVAYLMHSLLRGVVQRGTASRLSRWGLGYAAGKTGTTSDYRDAWFVGYTPDMVTTVWVGFDHGAPLRLSSGEAASPIWGSYLASIPHVHGEIKPPAGVTFRDIDPETGMLWQQGCPGPWREVFLNGTAPARSCPRGFFGQIVRHVFFDREHFDEPPAITMEQFRRWAAEADRNRQDLEHGLDRLKKIFGGE